MTNRVTDLVYDISEFVRIAAMFVIALAITGTIVQGAAAPTAGTASAAVTTTVAVATDTTTEDVTAEGQDVLLAFADTSPDALLLGLRAQGFKGDPGDGMDAFLVPTGTVIDVPGGLYRATVNGWAECRDTWFPQECNATGPVLPTRIPWHVADHEDAGAVAAGLILDELTVGRTVHHDFTYSGAPAVVTEFNGVLGAEWAAAGSPDRIEWLQQRADRPTVDRMASGKRMAEDLTWRGSPQVVRTHNDALMDGFDRTGGKNLRRYLVTVAGR